MLFLHCENRHFHLKRRGPAKNLGATGYRAPVKVHPCILLLLSFILEIEGYVKKCKTHKKKKKIHVHEICILPK